MRMQSICQNPNSPSSEIFRLALISTVIHHPMLFTLDRAPLMELNDQNDQKTPLVANESDSGL